ncbi:Ig-like domain-containing protein [Pseudenhygromyxa sp. WMMC2535]|uniref:Ig-like domain-containing protein n=1 Tax=Pseudenhygromyxa sp. WMMC2535 TaxID=2712867 RepID=UPI001553ECB0|nr:Ig-like domain-containing protein [Pseudenhygromyxa sp. WMMC2535]NVB37795.1 Ig-like domain-containing protein [Pseudenhygromyxa sp. WMMC2535]
MHKRNIPSPRLPRPQLPQLHLTLPRLTLPRLTLPRPLALSRLPFVLGASTFLTLACASPEEFAEDTDSAGDETGDFSGADSTDSTDSTDSGEADTGDSTDSGEAPSVDPDLLSFTVNGETEQVTIDEASVVTLHAEVTGEVERVDFYDLERGELIASDVEAPFEAFWIAASVADNGPRTFQAVAIAEDIDDSEAVAVSVELPERGILRWTLELSELSTTPDLVATPGGAAIVAGDQLGTIARDGELTWAASLPFAAEALALDTATGEFLVAGIDDSSLNLAGYSRVGEQRWVSDIGNTGDLNLEIEDIVVHDGRFALQASWGIGEPLLFMFDTKGPGEKPHISWYEAPGSVEAVETRFGQLAFDDAGDLLAPMQETILDDDDEPHTHSSVVRYDLDGEMSSVYESNDAGTSLHAVAVSDGQLFVGASASGEGTLLRLDADGQLLSSIGNLGESTLRLRADRGGVVLGAPQAQGADMFIGHVDGLGEVEWLHTYVDEQVEGEEVLEIDVDELGYVYVLTRAGEGFRVRSLHP